MLKVNKYIEVIDTKYIVNVGKYKIGKDLPCGEYYLWGKDIWYSYKRKSDRESHEYENEAYDVFEKGDILNLEAGTMTLVDNLHYNADESERILPGHIYRVGVEIPEGYYLFKFDKKYFKEPIWYCRNEEECAFDMYENYGDSRYHSETGKQGSVFLDSTVRHIKINNGIAAYCGTDKFDEEYIVNNSAVKENIYFNRGKKIFENKIMDILLYIKSSTRGRFCGEVPVDVLNYSIYLVGDELKWKADIYPLSFQNPYSMSIRFTDVFDKTISCVVKINKFAYHYDRDEKLKWFHVSLVLPDMFCGKEVKIELLEYNGRMLEESLVEDLELKNSYKNEDIHLTFKTEFKVLKELLNQFEGIDFDYEVKYFEKAPDLLMEVNECLREVINQRRTFERVCGNVERKIAFSVPTTYDKKYYCCAKLADSAYQVFFDENNAEYKVIFNGTQINEIELMSYLLYDVTKKEEIENREYLIQNSYTFFVLNSIQKKINGMNEKYGYSSVVTNSVLVRIIKSINKKLQQRVDNIYSDIGKEGRVRTRWGNEYRLYMLVSKYVAKTHYQYRCDWLGKQSYDVYLENHKIAIEYQGQQHYEAIDLFGGDEGLKYNRERDERKKKISEEHGIKILEWKYTVPVNEDSVLDFLNANGIKIEIVDKETHLQEENENRIEMAPIIAIEEKEKKKQRKVKEKKVKDYIVNYSIEGEMKDRYRTIGDAAKDVGISSTSISKALRGERNTAGGFIWKKYSLEDTIPETIAISFNSELTNSGISKKVAKIDNDGKVIAEYESIAEAAKANNIEYKVLQRKLKSCPEWKYL